MIRSFLKATPSLLKPKPLTCLRYFFTSVPLLKKPMPPVPMHLLKEDELEERFIKGGSGPGGQKINKTNMKVQLTHIPTGEVITVQDTRSQAQNRKIAKRRMACRLEELQDPENSRTAKIRDIKRAAKAKKKQKLKKKYANNEEKKPNGDDEFEASPPDIEAEMESFLAQYSLKGKDNQGKS